MAKSEDKMQDAVSASVHSLYSQLLQKRQQEREEKKIKIEEKKAEEKKEKDEKYINEDGTKMTKKERQKADMENWNIIFTQLTGDDLEYKDKKKNKKKYTKWIGEKDENSIINTKPKKIKKKNYQKQFEPDLNMLKTLVNQQNKFNDDLLKRWQLCMGPATKDSQMPTKTMVDLAAALNAGRSNSLSMLNNIVNIRKTIADLTMKQKKLDSELGGTNIGDNTDLALLGSSLGASILDNNINVLPPQNPYQETTPNMQPIISHPIGTVPPDTVLTSTSAPAPESFDPSTWGGVPNVSASTMFEAIPHTIVVEKNRGTNEMRFKAVRNDTGAELVGCPVPDYDINSLAINEKDGVVRGQFDEVYKIDEVG